MSVSDELNDIDDILDEEDIEKLIEEAPEVEQLDSEHLKKLIKSLEEIYNENTKLRIKFSDDPTK